MEKSDYRRFLYIATFRRNKLMIPYVLTVAFIGSFFINRINNTLNPVVFIITWILLTGLVIYAVYFMAVRKNDKRIKTNKTGTFDSINILKFYEDSLIMENESLHSTGEIRYDQIYKLMESKEYFIFYITIKQAFLLRKKDIENVIVFRNYILPKFKDRYRSLIWRIGS